VLRQVNPYHYSRRKRAIDLLFAILMFVCALPFLVIISAVIFFTSGKPVLFLQKRSGLNKKTFIVYKFRTMIANASAKQTKLKHLNQAPEPMFKIHDDPRFVGIGKWLSNAGLDELPQLINIIKGEMSLVGPRPLPVTEANKLPKEWDFRFLVKPGLFSYWTLDDRRHDSLKSWIELEKKTMTSSVGVIANLWLVFQNIMKQIKKIN